MDTRQTTAALSSSVRRQCILLLCPFFIDFFLKFFLSYFILAFTFCRHLQFTYIELCKVFFKVCHIKKAHSELRPVLNVLSLCNVKVSVLIAEVDGDVIHFAGIWSWTTVSDNFKFLHDDGTGWKVNRICVPSFNAIHAIVVEIFGPVLEVEKNKCVLASISKSSGITFWISTGNKRC